MRNPDAVRPWQHVLEPLAGYLWLAARLAARRRRVRRAWNFGPADEDGSRRVSWVVERVPEEWGAGSWTDAGGHGGRAARGYLLSLDSGKAREQLGWAPVWDCAAAVATPPVVPRVLRAPARRGELVEDQLRAYESDARRPVWPGRSVRRVSDERRDETVTDEADAEILELVGAFYEERHAAEPFDPGRDPVRYAGRVFGAEELRYLVDASLDFYLTASRFTEEFEAGWPTISTCPTPCSSTRARRRIWSR